MITKAEKAGTTHFLGREFLVWLWFKSEQGEGQIRLDSGAAIGLWLEGRMTLQSKEGQPQETVTCIGPNPEMREARFALKEDKKIIRAQIRLAIGDDEWSFILDASWLHFASLKTPRVVQDRKEDPGGLFYERVYLMEQPLAVMDGLFSSFIALRTSPDWLTKELPDIIRWIGDGD